MIELFLSMLATYVITSVISSYDGPFDIFARVRGEWEKPWSCFVCLSFWIAIPVIGLQTNMMYTLLDYFAVVGGAILMWKVSER